MSGAANQAMRFDGEWALLDENGGTAVAFTSFMGLSVNGESQALSCPVEEGGFVNYNKTRSPLNITVTLAVQGGEADFEYTLARLDAYKNEALTLSVATPAHVYGNMTLQSYSTGRAPDGGAHLLIVSLTLVEVREVWTQSAGAASGGLRNPTSAGGNFVGAVCPRGL